MSAVMTLTGKGQFTFNKQLMEHLGVKAGEKIVIEKLPDASLKIAAGNSQLDLMHLAGSLPSTVCLSEDALQDAISSAYVQAGMNGLE